MLKRLRVRVCSDCKNKPLQSNNKSGLCGDCWCKPNGPQAAYARAWRARNRRHLKEDKAHYHYEKAYGVPLETVKRLRAFQKGRCALCGTKPKQLQMDHEHATGRVRAFVCSYCNLTLGCIERIGIERLENYLKNADTGLFINQDVWARRERKAMRTRPSKRPAVRKAVMPRKTTLACSEAVVPTLQPSAT